jgi:hypothetical protein
MDGDTWVMSHGWVPLRLLDIQFQWVACILLTEHPCWRLEGLTVNYIYFKGRRKLEKLGKRSQPP